MNTALRQRTIEIRLREIGFSRTKSAYTTSRLWPLIADEMNRIEAAERSRLFFKSSIISLVSFVVGIGGGLLLAVLSVSMCA